MRIIPQHQRLFLVFAVAGVSLRTLWPHQPITNMVIGSMILLLLAPFFANAMIYQGRFRRR